MLAICPILSRRFPVEYPESALKRCGFLSRMLFIELDVLEALKLNGLALAFLTEAA